MRISDWSSDVCSSDLERLLARVDRAVDGAPSSLAALEAVFMTPVDFVAEHPGVPRMLFGELQRSADNLPRTMVQTLIGRYGERLRRLFEAGKDSGELDPGRAIGRGACGETGGESGWIWV